MSSGDADDALTVLARERAGALFGYAYLLTGNRDAAADLVQEGLVRTFSRTRTGFAPGDPSSPRDAARNDVPSPARRGAAPSAAPRRRQR